MKLIWESMEEREFTVELGCFGSREVLFDSNRGYIIVLLVLIPLVRSSLVDGNKSFLILLAAVIHSDYSPIIFPTSHLMIRVPA